MIALVRIVPFALSIAAGVQAPKLKPNPEKSIQAGLAWLARHQSPDGSWGGRSLTTRCSGDRRCYEAKIKLSEHYDEGLTGLALLCFLRAGYDDKSVKEVVDPLTGKPFDAAGVVRNGLSWLKKSQRKDGSFGRERPFLYNHAIAALAMIESYAATRDGTWKESAVKGVDYLQKAQRTNPTDDGLWGWRYAGRQEIEASKPKKIPEEKAEAWEKELHDSDVSATGWAVAVLAAAIQSGLDVHEKSLKGALDFVNHASRTDGLVGYLSSAQAGMKVEGPFDEYRYHVGSMSAIAILIRWSTVRDRSSALFDAAAEQILKDLPEVSPDDLSIDYYYWYHGTQALDRLEGSQGPNKKKRKIADPWNKAVLEVLTRLQDHAPDACSRGGWVVADRWNLYAGGPVYSTAMSVLALETIVNREGKR